MKIANVAVGMEPYGSRLCAWLKKRRPDIITIQKIGSKFPKKENLLEIGYEGAFLPSPRWYLGVAILCHRDLLKKPEVRICQLAGAEQDGPRFLTVDIGGLWVSSVYAPYGPEGRGKRRVIERRVAWLNRLRDHVSSEGYNRRDSLLCGDFNVKVKADGLPLPEKKFYSEEEQEALEELLHLAFVDLYRRAHPCVTEDPGWTRGYSENNPTKGDARLHLILGSKSLTDRLRSACVDVESKPWPRKDAPPLVVDLDDV